MAVIVENAVSVLRSSSALSRTSAIGFVRAEGMHELAWKVQMQSGDRWIGTVHPKSEYAPGRLEGRDIATVDEINDLVDFWHRLISGSGLGSALCSLLYHDSGSIVTLVDILVEILDCSGRGAALDIDVSTILCGQIGIMRNDPTIVNLQISQAIDPDRSSIHATPILRISSRSVRSIFEEGLGIAFSTHTVLHARRVHVHRSTWAMDHGFNDSEERAPVLTTHPTQQ